MGERLPRGIATRIMLALLIVILTLTLKVWPVRASGSVFIRADGRVDPSTASIKNVNNVTYILTGNINESIIVERDNIIIDGAGYTIQGKESGRGIDLTGRSNVAIKNVNIEAFFNGIYLWYSTNNIISGNNITGSVMSGIRLFRLSHNNTMHGNNITGNTNGIGVVDSSGNRIYGNNIIHNDLNMELYGYSLNFIWHNNFVSNLNQVYAYNSNNVWDDGYPSGGNYWSDHNNTDTNEDGVGENPYQINQNNTDNYPLMAPINIFETGTYENTTYYVEIVSNSTVLNLAFNPQEGAFMAFNVSGHNGTVGFCRVTIPKSLLWTEDEWTIQVGGETIADYIVIPDENSTYLYFTYPHSTKTVQIKGTHVIPEYPTIIILSLLVIATLLAVIIYRYEKRI